MPLEILQMRKKQSKVTRVATAGAIVFHILLALLFFTKVQPPPVRTVITGQIPTRVRPPEAPSTRPIDPLKLIQIRVREIAPPEDPVVWKGAEHPVTIKGDPVGPEGDDPKPVFVEASFGSGELLWPMTSPIRTFTEILLPAPEVKEVGVKSEYSGTKRRLSGRSAIAILDIPGTASAYPWESGELGSIADYVSRNTSLRVGLGARAISFLGQYASFDRWLASARDRGPSDPRAVGRIEPEIDALEALADAVPYAADRAYEDFRVRVRAAVAGYFRARFDARFDPADGGWSGALKNAGSIREWQVSWLDEAEQAYQGVFERRAPMAGELRGVYLMLREFEMAQLPVLLCEPRGVPAELHPETIRLLKAYVENGGFIYFANTARLDRARAIRGLIADIVGDRLADAEGEATLARMSAGDQEVTGFVAREPVPRVGHPWVFFPMIIPHRTDLAISIYNRAGVPVYRREFRDVEPKAYLQKYRHFRWHMVDNDGNMLESGYYIYRIEAGLFRTTGAVGISRLRMLPSGKHGIFSAFYPISEVPSTVRVKAEELAYGQEGLFGVTIRGRTAIVYAEGYGEKDALDAMDNAGREAALKWMTNVVMFALSERAMTR